MQLNQRTILALLSAACALAGSRLTAAERYAWLEGHGDVAVNYLKGQWQWHVEQNRDPADVLITLRDNSRTGIPADPAFNFLGAAGDPIWIIPAGQTPGIPFLGINSQLTPSGTFVNDRFELRLSSVQAPGDFVMWTIGGTGAPTVQMNSRDGLALEDKIEAPAGGHFHQNWGFTKPGTYRVGFKAAGTPVGQPEPTVSEAEVYTFEVGVLKKGEVDLEVAYERGVLEFHLHDETTDTEFDPAHVALQAGPATWQTVPKNPAFSFLGAPGEHLYVLPQQERAGVLFLGLAAGEVGSGIFAGDTLNVQLTAVTGPGAVYYYAVDGFGSPTTYFNSADGLGAADVVPVTAGAHAHRNWAFSAPGVYRITLVASGQLAGGSTVKSEPTTFLFEVLPPQFFDRGEIDLEIVFEAGSFELELLDEAVGREYAAQEAVLVGRPPTRAKVPADPAFAFLGNPGATVYVLPQKETANVLFLGLAADEIAPSLFTGDSASLQLASLDGPGQLALYATDAFGSPTVFWNSANGLNAGDRFPAAVGSHSHVNWAFTAPGVYRVGLKAVGTPVAGNQPVESEIVTFSFEINAPVVFDQGEIDFEIVYEDAEWELVLLDEAAGREYQADEVLLVAQPAAKQTVPNDPAFAFLGAPGSAVHILPQVETAGLLFPGIAADEIAPGLFVNEKVNLTLVAKDGPGELALYSVNGFGSPTVFINSRDGVGAADVYPVAVGSHSHLNWAFSAPGEYALTFKAFGTLAAGATVTASAEVTLSFLIQDAGPVLTASTVNGGTTLRIGWASKTGVRYQLQSRPALTTGNWSDVGEPINGDGTPKSVDAPITDDTLKVFQVVVLP